MSISLDGPSRVSLLFLCLLGLGVVTWSGCDKPDSAGDESAEANQPSNTESAGNKADPPGSPAEEDPPPKPGTAEKRKPGSPSPSAGKTGDQKRAKIGDKPPAPGGAKPEGGDKISDAELEKFVEANEIMQSKRKQLKKELDQAESPSEAKKAQKQVMQEARKAAEEAGFSFERFRAISRRAKADPALQKRLRALTIEREAAGGQ